MKFCRKLSGAALVILASALLSFPAFAAPPGKSTVNVGRVAAEITEIVIRLQGDAAGDDIQPVTDAQMERLNAAAGMRLVARGLTRNGGQVLELPVAMSVGQARAVVSKIRRAPEVLWAELGKPQMAQAKSRSSGPAAVGGGGGDRIVVKLNDPESHRTAERNEALDAAVLARLGEVAGVPLAHLRPMSGGAFVLMLPRKVSAAEMAEIIDRLQRDPMVKYAEPVLTAKPMLVPNDTYYPMQWNYFELPGGANLPAAWDTTSGSAGVVVAVLDSGILPHPDLAGRYLTGYDMITDVWQANDGNGRDGDPRDPGDWVAAGECGAGEPAESSSWHGLHVAGTVGAASNNGQGVAGVTWEAKILPVRVLGKCGGLSSDIDDAIRWAAGLGVPGVPANPNPARVINLSLGYTAPCGVSSQAAINDALAVGAVVVVVAGNENMDVASSSPANCSGVISVAAHARDGDITGYSNYGAGVKISAPGGNGPEGGADAIDSTYNSGTTVPASYTYRSMSGTSAATPHVSGVAALMLSVNGALTPAQVTALMQGSARPFAAGTWCAMNAGNCGAGLLDAAGAVNSAKRLLPQSGGMILNLEEPVSGGSASGVGNVRGWAVSQRTLRRVDLYVDGTLAITVPYGSSRGDVGAAYPSYPGSGNSGFSMAYNFGNLSAGSHTFMARAVDDVGSYQDASTTFNVVRFPASFIANPGEVSLLGASVTMLDGNTFRLNHVAVQGLAYNLTLRWSTATQGFALVAVNATGTGIAALAAPAPFSGAASLPQSGGVIAYLEEPVSGGSASGVGNVRGWAVSQRAVRRVDLYVDGTLAFSVPYGGSRGDVGAAYPSYPDSGNSGFSMAYNFGNLSAGSHTFMARAVDDLGSYQDASATFNVVRFPASFIANPGEVSLLGASATMLDGNTFRLNNVAVQGVAYNLTLRWSTATQGFVLVGI
ncbi:MAG: S8 family peptidase [Sulfuricella sp.]